MNDPAWWQLLGFFVLCLALAAAIAAGMYRLLGPRNTSWFERRDEDADDAQSNEDGSGYDIDDDFDSFEGHWAVNPQW